MGEGRYRLETQDKILSVEMLILDAQTLTSAERVDE